MSAVNRIFAIGLLLAGCSVYDANLLDAGNNDASGGCPRGLADCDGDGACESDLMSEETCGNCSSRCTLGETCVAGVLCVPGDVREFDVGPLDGGTDGGPRDGGDDPDAEIPDAGVEDAGPPDTTPPCYIEPPPRPDIADMADLSDHVYALRDVVLDQGADRWQTIGYDLDEQCTDSIDDPFHCTPAIEPLPPFDGPMGVDNTFGERVLSLIGGLDPNFQDSVRNLMLQGNTAILIVKDYNGEPNDPLVDVQFVRALGVTGGGAPAWDGSDTWIRSEDSYSPVTDDPLLRDEGAYVADGILVARFPDRQPIVLPWLNNSRFTIRMTDAVLTGAITSDGDRLDPIVFQGRFARTDLASTLAEAGFCVGSTARGFVDLELDKGADVRALPGSGGPGAICDAVSMAIQYAGWRAEAGPRQDPPLPDPVVCLP